MAEVLGILGVVAVGSLVMWKLVTHFEADICAVLGLWTQQLQRFPRRQGELLPDLERWHREWGACYFPNGDRRPSEDKLERMAAGLAAAMRAGGSR